MSIGYDGQLGGGGNLLSADKGDGLGSGVGIAGGGGVADGGVGSGGTLTDASTGGIGPGGRCR